MTTLDELDVLDYRRYARHLKQRARDGELKAFLSFCVADEFLDTNPAKAKRATDEVTEESDDTSKGDGAAEEADTGTGAPTQEDSEEQSTNEPAFAFDETDMHGFYVRQGTWNQVTQMRSSVTAACSMFDVPEFEGREFQDACLRVMSDHADEIALQILRERGIEADEDRIREVVEMLNTQAEDD